MVKIVPGLLCLLAVLLTASSEGFALTREEVITRARSYVDIGWRCGPRNARREFNLLEPRRNYLGVTYNWGGFDSPELFLKKIRLGIVGGNHRKYCGNHLCRREDFAGLDCSGFVSRTWGTRRLSTQALPLIAIKILRNLLKPGDILNSHQKHVVLFDTFDDEGQMWIYESSSWVRQKGSPPAGVVYRPVDLGDDYVPRRFYKFIKLGDTVRTERPVLARERLKGGKRWTIPADTKGTIVQGPEFPFKPKDKKIPANVCYRVKYENGKEGWSILRDLLLIKEAESSQG